MAIVFEIKKYDVAYYAGAKNVAAYPYRAITCREHVVPFANEALTLTDPVPAAGHLVRFPAASEAQ